MASSMQGKAPEEALDHEAALRSAPLLRDFTPVGIRILARAARRRSVGRGTYAFRAGEPSSSLAVIARGRVQLLAREGGAPLGEVSSGDVLGGLGLLARGEHLVSAFASTDVDLLELDAPTFEELRRTKPGVSLKLMMALAGDFAERLREARGPLREFLAWQVSKRQGDPKGSRPGS
jgi:CRP-like cAMP-binding protein